MLLPLMLVGLALATPTSAEADPSIESQVFAKVRGSRFIVQHSGLLSAARNHSMGMARRGGLDHNDADARIRNAPPDPFETNGAPDDGSPPASWCENVTYVMAAPQSEVAGRIYAAWERSGAHDRCMKEAHRNVGAVGVYYDGQTWWATFIAMVDNTPPGGAQPPPKATPQPKAADETRPAATQAPAAADPEASDAPVTSSTEATGPAGLLDDDASTPATEEPSTSALPGSEGEEVRQPDHVPSFANDITTSITTKTQPLRDAAQAMDFAYGWQELVAVAALLALATAVLRRAREPLVQRPPEMERRDDVALPEVEPVGAGAVRV